MLPLRTTIARAFTRLWVLLACGLWLVACTGERSGSGIPAAGTGQQVAAPALSDKPLGLVTRLPYPDFPADGPARLGTAAATETISIVGEQFSDSYGQFNHGGTGTEPSYSLISQGSNAWAEYETDALGGSRPISIAINAQPVVSSTDGATLPLRYWVALADYRLGRWQWQGPFDSAATLSLDTIVFSQRYFSAAGKLHLAVFTSGSFLARTGVRISSIDITPGGYRETMARISNAANFAAAQQQPQGDDGNFDFIVIGDDRSGEAVYAQLLEQMRPYDPAFIINTGDIVPHGYLSEIEAYAQLIDSYDVPILSVPGNHDIADGPGNYATWFGPSEWSFAYGGCRFVGLDNANGKFSTPALAFAQDNLTSEALCFLSFHKPPPIERWKVHGMQTDEQDSNLTPMLDVIESSRTDAVFLGHIHLFDEMEIRGIPWIISGAGGSPLAKQYGFGLVEFGFVVVHVKGQSWSYEWVKKAAS